MTIEPEAFTIRTAYNCAEMAILIYSILSVTESPAETHALLSEIRGMQEEELSMVIVDKIAVVTSNIQESPIKADQQNALAFAAVIESLAHHFTLLPVRFGTMMDSAATLTGMLGRNYDDILSNLLKVEGKSEFGLKVFCDSHDLMAQLKSKSETNTSTVSNPAPEIKSSVFKAYVNRKLEEHRQEEMLLSFIDSVIAEIRESLNSFNAIARMKKKATETNIVDAVFLLKMQDKDALIQTVRGFQDRHPELNYVLTGPWPPYSFVEFTIK